MYTTVTTMCPCSNNILNSLTPTHVVCVTLLGSAISAHPPSTKDCKLCCAQFFTAHANKNSKVNEMMVGDPVELPVDLVLAVNQHGLHVARQLEPTGPPVILTTSKVFCIPFESESRFCACQNLSRTLVYVTSPHHPNEYHKRGKAIPNASLTPFVLPVSRHYSLATINPPSLPHTSLEQLGFTTLTNGPATWERTLSFTRAHPATQRCKSSL